MNNKDYFTFSAIKPTQIAIVIYAIVKQIFVTLFVDADNWKFRLIISIIWLTIVFIVTNSKKFSRRQIAMAVLTTSVIQEIIYFTLSHGDRMIFIFLIGISLLSIMYADWLVMLITMSLSCISISFCIFVLGIKSTVGFEYDFIHDAFNVAGLVMINTVIFLIGKYTIGTLAKAQNEAENANKAKSNFLATMSHEIRTPMNAITGIAQIQLLKNNLPDEYAQALEKIHRSSHSLLGIINDILDLSKIETGKMEINHVEYDVPGFIHDTVQINIVRLGSKQIEIILDIDQNLPTKLIGDELRLKQILNNLLSNAIKYTEKGQVKLSVSHLAKEEYVILRFTVEDTGQGMKPEDCNKLFSEYTRFNIDSNRSTEGTGIGLNITKNLVELMEGTIKAESEYGKGSIFTVTIKQQAVECEAIGYELSQRLCSFTFSREKQKTNLQILHELMPYGKVLIVDDVDTNLYVAEGLMSTYDLEIDTAISGYQVIEKVKSGRTYDVIFMDHMMPGMDGIETTQKLRTMGYDNIIVALTANALAGNAQMFRENGFNDFISKPIDLRELNAVLNKYVRDRHLAESREKRAERSGDEVPEEREQRTGKLFEIFRKDAEKAVISLRETFAAGDIKLFTTTVHAMKSALANIGEDNKSEEAFRLEKAGLNGDIEFIAANKESFIESLEMLIKNIMKDLRPKEFVNDSGIPEDRQNESHFDLAYLKEQLKLIKAACIDYDDTAAYTVLDRLKEKIWKTETSTALENIRDTLYLHSDFDEAARQASFLINDAALLETHQGENGL